MSPNTPENRPITNWPTKVRAGGIAIKRFCTKGVSKLLSTAWIPRYNRATYNACCAAPQRNDTSKMRDLEHSQPPGHPFRNFNGRCGLGGIRSRHVTSTATTMLRRKEIIRREAPSLEDCRRGANEVHLKREDTWRTSTADFLTSSRRVARTSRTRSSTNFQD